MAEAGMSSCKSAESNDDEEDLDEIPNKKLFKEIFYITNDTQSNIYCSAKLRYPSTTQERFLIGTLDGKVLCLERREVKEARERFHSCHDMQSRGISFTYIPTDGDAELISMDAFYRSQTVRGSKCLIVGVTLILLKKNLPHLPPEYFFNIYNALEPGTEFDLDKLAQVCQHQKLNFIPYHLYHGDIYSNGTYETVFLLAGSDERIHVFLGDDQQRFEEQPCEKYFPEFLDIQGRVIWMSVQNCDSFKRLASAGCDNGYLRVTMTDVLKVEVLKTWSLSMDGPISSVHLFTLAAEKEVIFTQSPCKETAALSPRHLLSDSEEQHLLVTSALECSVVFLNVASKGLKDMIVLEQSDQFDCVTCSRVRDIDCDGKKEILLGTYGQEMLIYKWYPTKSGSKYPYTFKLFWRKPFSKPLLAIHSLDLMGDGMQELVVVSLTGVHILQHDIQLGADKILYKICRAFAEDKSLYENSYYSEENSKRDSEERRSVGALQKGTSNFNELPSAMRRVDLEDDPVELPTVKRGI